MDAGNIVCIIAGIFGLMTFGANAILEKDTKRAQILWLGFIQAIALIIVTGMGIKHKDPTIKDRIYEVADSIITKDRTIYFYEVK